MSGSVRKAVWQKGSLELKGLRLGTHPFHSLILLALSPLRMLTEVPAADPTLTTPLKGLSTTGRSVSRSWLSSCSALTVASSWRGGEEGVCV